MAKISISYPVFRHPPQVMIGRGSFRSLPCLMDSGTALFLSNADSVQRHVFEILDASGASHVEERCFTKPPGEPTAAMVRAGAGFLRALSPKTIVAVGGGSVLDLARLAAAESAGCLDLTRAAIDADGNTVVRPAMYLAPTTCGTGAEAADVVVYTDDSGLKRAIVSRWFAADLAVLDGRLVDSLDSARIAAFVCDAVSHCIEAFVSIVPNSLAKDAAISAMSVILSNYMPDPAPEQKDRLLEASFLAGTAATNCSVGIVHAFAHALGADGIAHGLANACALETGINFNKDTRQLRDLIKRLGLRDVDHLDSAVRRLTSVALSGGGAMPAIRKLEDSNYRQELAERMGQDVAIRTNPRRSSPVERGIFVDQVFERLQAL